MQLWAVSQRNARVCARTCARVCVCVSACVRVGVEKYEVGYARGTLEIWWIHFALMFPTSRRFFLLPPPSCAQSRASHHVRIINVLHKDLWKRSEISVFFLKKEKKSRDKSIWFRKIHGQGYRTGWLGRRWWWCWWWLWRRRRGGRNQYSGDEDRLVRRRWFYSRGFVSLFLSLSRGHLNIGTTSNAESLSTHAAPPPPQVILFFIFPLKRAVFFHYSFCFGNHLLSTLGLLRSGWKPSCWTDRTNI